MASIVLRAYLSPDIVDYVIVPYLQPLKEQVEKNYHKLFADFDYVMSVTMFCRNYHDVKGVDSQTLVAVEALNYKFYERSWIYDHVFGGWKMCDLKRNLFVTQSKC